VALLVILAAASACGDIAQPTALAPADLAQAEVRGDGQKGTVDAPLADSVAVTVTSRGGTPARDVTLEWRVLGEGGGAARFPTTRTDQEGRSANVWVLGRRSGEYALEIRAVLPEGAIALDTVHATASAGPVTTLALQGDTSRTLVLQDTVRLALSAADRFGNPIDSAALRAQWSTGDAAVAAVDSAGRVRAVGFGATTVEARAGTQSARLRLRVDARVEVFPVTFPGEVLPPITGMTGNGTRVVATARGENSTYLLSLDGSRWTAQRIAPQRPSGQHVTPEGAALISTEYSTYISGPDGRWTSFAPIPFQSSITGVGEKIFARKDDSSVHIYRLDGEQVTDLRLPSRYLPGAFRLFGVVSPTDVYAAVDSAYYTILMHWDGAGWSRVLTPGDTTPLLVYRVQGAPNGGVLWGWADNTSTMYRIRGGVAERVELPPATRADYNATVAVSEAGQPYLLYPGRIVYQTAAGWRSLPIPGDWTGTTLWPAADGVVWVGARRLTGVDSAGQTTWEVAFLRITTAG
jgi:hypothetical protein